MSRSPVDAAMYARVFGHGEGALILEDLTARFFDVDVYAPGGEDGARETSRRAARREVVRFILQRIAQLNEPPGDDDQDPQPAG